MNQYIWEYDKNYDGLAYCVKHIVVYENKTYYYCKRNGIDRLTEINKESVGTPNSKYFLTKNPNLDKETKQFALEKEIARLKEEIAACDRISNQYSGWAEESRKKKQITQTILESLTKQLEESYN